MKYIDDKFSPKTGKYDLLKIEHSREIKLVMHTEETILHVNKEYPIEEFRALYSMLTKIKDIPNLYFSMHQAVTQIPGTWIATELKQTEIYHRL